MMSLVKKSFGFVLLAALAVGCKQDPLEGFDEATRKALPPQNTKTNPLKSDAIVIDVNQFYDTEEGATLSFKIVGRVLLPRSTAKIEIKNTGAFPGMSYDERTGEFSWPVPIDYVSTGERKIVSLNVLMITDQEPFLYDEKMIQITVLRKNVRPTIVSLTPIPEIAEGNSFIADLVVKSERELTNPTLSVLMTSGRDKNASGFISIYRGPEQDSRDPSLWSYRLYIDLENIEITKLAESFYFDLQVVSSHGVPSLTQTFDFVIRTNPAAPVFTWESSTTAQFVADQKGTHVFEVYDPKFEGKLKMDMAELCKPLAGAACACSARGSVLQCKIEWTPTAQNVGRYSLRAEAINTIDVPWRGQYSQTALLNRVLSVQPGAQP